MCPITTIRSDIRVVTKRQKIAMKGIIRELSGCVEKSLHRRSGTIRSQTMSITLVSTRSHEQWSLWKQLSSASLAYNNNSTGIKFVKLKCCMNVISVFY